MSIPRAFDWPERFNAFIDSRRHMPFAWGSNDCGLFVADGILMITGVDLGAKFRGYKTEAGAMRKVRKAGGMEGLAADLTPKHEGLAQRGDVILATVEGRETYGLVGLNFWCAPGADRLVFRPLSDAIKVFEY
jgi:uncharacterized protein DUF6950